MPSTAPASHHRTLTKETKDQLIKARCTRTMKSAVLSAADDMPGDNHDESDVVRVALEEYLTRRGYLPAKHTARIAEDAGSYKTATKKAARKKRTPQNKVSPAPPLRRRTGAQTPSQAKLAADTIILRETLRPGDSSPSSSR